MTKSKFKNDCIILNTTNEIKSIVHEYNHSLTYKYVKDNNKEYTEHREKVETKLN